jgi:outer membrane protein OmpA-like peptidoglycan-associated protein/streptogramin lyase
VGLAACCRPAEPKPPVGHAGPLVVDRDRLLLRPDRLDVHAPTSTREPLSCPPLSDDLDSLRVSLDAAVLFDVDEAALRPDAEDVLARFVAQTVVPYPRARLIVEGHTDDQGREAHNDRLSRRRAAAVAQWIVAHGIAGDRVQSRGFGERRPIVANDTEEGRAANRRVEVVIEGVSAGGQCGPARACCVVDDPACVGADVHASAWTGDPTRRGVFVDDRVARLCETSEVGHAVWVTSTGDDEVVKFDAHTGRELLRVPTWGDFPQRTAIGPDGSVWITNRESGSYVHLRPDGTVRCASDYGTCTTRAAAVDPSGKAWIGCYDDKEVRRVEPQGHDGEVLLVDEASGRQQLVGRCRESARIELDATAPYGLAADGEGGLWVTSNLGTTVAKIDTNTAERIAEFDVKHDRFLRKWGGCFSPYGITIDREGNPWFGNYLCGTVLKMDGDTGRIVGSFGGGGGRRLQRPRALGLDRDGNVWVAENAGTGVVKLSPRGGFLRRVDLRPCGGDAPGPLGTGSDADGNMWTVLQKAGKVAHYTTDGKILGCYPEDGELSSPYTYADLTGSLLALVTRDTGRVHARIEAGDAATQWSMLTLRVSTPGGAKACLRARAAETPAALADAAWSGRACPTGEGLVPRRVSLRSAERGGPRGRWLEIELTLSPGPAGAWPVVADLSAAGVPPSRP